MTATYDAATLQKLTAESASKPAKRMLELERKQLALQEKYSPLAKEVPAS